MTAPIPKSKLSEISKLFGKAEDTLKLAEHLVLDLSIPAVNQLRYAGFHLTQAHVAKKDKISYHIESVIRHCKRAIYDSYEVSILYLLKEIAIFRSDYNKILITPVIQNYSEKVNEIEEIKKHLQSVNKDHREDHHANIEVDYDKLLAIRNLFEISREELNKSIKSERNKFIIKAAAVLIAVLSLLFVILKYFKDCNSNYKPDKQINKTVKIEGTKQHTRP